MHTVGNYDWEYCQEFRKPCNRTIINITQDYTTSISLFTQNHLKYKTLASKSKLTRVEQPLVQMNFNNCNLHMLPSCVVYTASCKHLVSTSYAPSECWLNIQVKNILNSVEGTQLS